MVCQIDCNKFTVETTTTAAVVFLVIQSITGAICANAIPMVTELISVNRYQSRESVSLQTYLQTNRRMFEKYCATTHIWNLAFAQVSSFDSNGRLLASTEAFIQFLGRNSLSTCICTDVNMLSD